MCGFLAYARPKNRIRSVYSYYRGPYSKVDGKGREDTSSSDSLLFCRTADVIENIISFFRSADTSLNKVGKCL
jgi:hypothetical protein